MARNPESHSVLKICRRAARCAAGTFALAAGAHLHASEAPPGGEPVVRLDPFSVVAHPSGADERTASVWVVSQPPDAIAPAGIADLFATIPGLQIDQPGGPGGRSTLYLRGGEENHALVFLDGVPLNDPTNSRGGAVDFSVLEPELVHTIAVVRGPASVRYGPEALAGVVHLETAQAAGGRASAEAGGDDFRRAAISLGKDFDGLSVQLAAGGTDDGSLEDGSRVRRRAARASVAFDAPVDIRVSAWRFEHDADNFPDDSGGIRHAALRELERREDEQTGAALQLGAQNARGGWTLTADAAQFDATVVSPGVAPGVRDPAGVPASEDDTRLRRLRASAAMIARGESWTLTGGADVQHEDGRDTGVLFFGPFAMPTDFEIDRTRVGAFAEAGGPQHAPVVAVVGARVDRFDDELTRGTARAGLLGTIDAATQWRINAGTAFKPPSFYALANPLVGNPDLRPERGTTLDAGLRRAFAGGRGLLDLTVFTSRFHDGIDFDPGPPPRLVNRNAVRSQGAEAALMFRVGETLAVAGALTYDDARSDPGRVRMRSRPRWRGGLSASWTPLRELTLAAAFTAVGDVPDSSVATGDVLLDEWSRLDLRAVWRVSETVDLTAALDNALDADYEEAAGFVAPGRRVRAGVRVTF